MSVQVGLLMVLVLLFSGCTDESNSDSQTETSCASATGAWDLSTVTCDGAAANSPGAYSFVFNSPTAMALEIGYSDCVSSIPWSWTVQTNAVNFTGSGNLSCRNSSGSINSCTGVGSSCSNTADATGLVNNFSSCVISNSQMTLTRTVGAANDPDDFSFCSQDQVEVITLARDATGTTPNPPNLSVALLVISDGPVYDFGSTTVGNILSRTFTVTNLGGAVATSIAGAGLAAPFQFTGGVYPGTGGTCAATLAAAANCTIVVNFSPAAAGSASDTIELNYFDGAANQVASRDVFGNAN